MRWFYYMDYQPVTSELIAFVAKDTKRCGRTPVFTSVLVKDETKNPEAALRKPMAEACKATWKATRSVIGGALADNFPDLITHAKMYALGVKYDLEKLQQLANAKFQLALRHSTEIQKGFAEVVQVVCTSTPTSDMTLRRAVARHVADHYEAMEEEDFRKMVFSHHELNYEIGIVMWHKNGATAPAASSTTRMALDWHWSNVTQ